MKKNIFIKCSCVFAVLWILSGCNDLAKEYHYEKYIYVSSSSLTMYVGEEFKLNASPAGETFGWTSENAGIATVSADGTVKAAGIGETNIVVSQNSASSKVPVKVITPKIDSLTARPGDRSARFEITINTDKAKSVKIINTGTDESHTVDINLQSGKFNFTYPDLPEDNIRFSLVCIDAFGNESDPVYATVSVYNRDTYIGRLTQRQVRAATKLGNGLSIAWTGETGAFCELYYTDVSGKRVTKKTDVRPDPDLLLDFKSGLSYKTVYVVEFDEATVDTFRLAEVTPAVNDKSHVISAAATCEIKAWNFDFGGEGVGYHDDNGKDGSSSYREYIGDPDGKSKVDIDGGTENPDNIGWTSGGEWLAYTVEVIDGGDYAIDLEVGVNGDTSVSFETDDGAQTTGAFALISWGGGYGGFRWYCAENGYANPVLHLTEGIQKIKFNLLNGNFNIRSFKFTKQ